jgi:hypothetical protein
LGGDSSGPSANPKFDSGDCTAGQHKRNSLPRLPLLHSDMRVTPPMNQKHIFVKQAGSTEEFAVGGYLQPHTLKTLKEK